MGQDDDKEGSGGILPGRDWTDEGMGLRALLNSLPGPVYRCRNTPSWTMSFISDRCRELTGYGADELIDDAVVAYGDLIDVADRDGVWDAVQEALARRAHFEVRYRIRRRGGDLRWVLERGAGVFVSDEIVAIEGFVTDIHDQCLADAQRRERGARLQAIVDTALDGIVTMDARGIVTTFNAAAERMFGYAAAEVVGQNVSMLMPDPVRAEHDAYLDRYHRTGQAQIIGVGREVVACRKDGTLFPAELGVSRMEIDGSTHFTGIVRDITARREAQQVQFETLDALRGIQEITARASGAEALVADLLRMGCARFDVDVGILSRIDGETCVLEQVHGPGADAQAGTVVPLADSSCATSWQQGGLMHFADISPSTGMPHPFGDGRIVRAYIGVPIWIGGRVYGVLCFVGTQARPSRFTSVEDELVKLMGQTVEGVLQRRVAEDALHEAERRYLQAQKLEAVGRLASGVAHDFKNLLAGIMGCVDVAMASDEDPDAIAMSLNLIRTASERGVEMVRQLLAVSHNRRIALGAIDLNPVLVALRDLLVRVLRDDIQLELVLADDCAPILGDAGYVDQIVMNLAVNARDAMPAGGRLTIRTTTVTIGPDAPEDLPSGDFVVLTVEDTGTGMDAATRERVLDPFFTTKSDGEGTGLGLATVHAIVKRMHGGIEIDSTPGVGTSVRVLFPRNDPTTVSEVPDRTRSIPSPDGEGLSHKTVLVVDDEELVRSSATFYLRSLGCRILEAASGEEALQCVVDHPGRIDVLLSDVVMPVMGGRELATTLLAHQPDLAVVLMSAFPRETLIADGRLVANTPTLEKPFSDRELMAALLDALGQKG